MSSAKNVLGGELQSCCKFPMTGFYRDGYCHTGEEDLGQHTICIEVTEEFLEFSQASGNDLSTPHPELDFPGLIPGDCWCLCALRWEEAYNEGKAPLVNLAATNENALEVISLEALQEHAMDDKEEERLI